jgi:hypothetical protein
MHILAKSNGTRFDKALKMPIWAYTDGMVAQVPFSDRFETVYNFYTGNYLKRVGSKCPECICSEQYDETGDIVLNALNIADQQHTIFADLSVESLTPDTLSSEITEESRIVHIGRRMAFSSDPEIGPLIDESTSPKRHRAPSKSSSDVDRVWFVPNVAQGFKSSA